MPKVTIVIVCWNSALHLSRCLSSLSVQTCQDFEVVIVDNGSVDESVDDIDEKYSTLDVSVERLSENHGFAIANNIGARLAQGEWLALLNADAFPEPDWLENLINATGDYPEFTCFSSRQVQANRPDLLDGTRDSYHVSGVAWRRNIDY